MTCERRSANAATAVSLKKRTCLLTVFKNLEKVAFSIASYVYILSWLKMPKPRQFWILKKTWSLWSNSVTRQVNFYWTKIEKIKWDTLGDFQTLCACCWMGIWNMCKCLCEKRHKLRFEIDAASRLAHLLFTFQSFSQPLSPFCFVFLCLPFAFDTSRNVSHTVRKSQNLFKKWQNCEFEFSCQKLIICGDFYTLIFLLGFVQIQLFPIFDQNHDFWREKSNYSSVFFF